MRRILIIVLVVGCGLGFMACSPYPSESKRMAMAFEQAQLVYGEGENDTLLFIPELNRASVYYARNNDYGKAALAALYHGYAEKDYDKTEAMNAFKDAERYGELVNDSLTVARARYQMGNLLYGDYIYEDAMGFFNKSEAYFGQHYSERSLALNSEACCYLILKDYSAADSCLCKALHYAYLGDSEMARQKVLNNYSVLYSKQKEYDKAIDCLRKEKPTNRQQLLLNQLNFGNVFLAMGAVDSAANYYRLVEIILETNEIRKETRASAYNSISLYEELIGNMDMALKHRKEVEKTLDELQAKREQKSIYYIQKKYDYESLQNAMNQRLANKQRIIVISCIMLTMLSIALTISQIRLARKRKREAEINEALFHFMNQNKDLAQANTVMEQNQIKAEESIRDLAQKYLESQNTTYFYAKELSEALEKERKTMMRLHTYLQTPKDKSQLKALETTVFEDKDHWEALLGVLNKIYPNQWETQKSMFPDLEEDEQKVLMLSRFRLSRQEEASLLNTSVHMIDKIRARMRAKTGQKTKFVRK